MKSKSLVSINDFTRDEHTRILDLAEDFLLAKQGKNKITFEIARRITAESRALLKKFVKMNRWQVFADFLLLVVVVV